jgi:hypothetical protein
MFSGCVNKRSESVDVTDVTKELSEWFPDQKGISVISWRSVLLVEEMVVPGEKHRPVASH